MLARASYTIPGKVQAVLGCLLAQTVKDRKVIIKRIVVHGFRRPRFVRFLPNLLKTLPCNISSGRRRFQKRSVKEWLHSFVDTKTIRLRRNNAIAQQLVFQHLRCRHIDMQMPLKHA